MKRYNPKIKKKGGKLITYMAESMFGDYFEVSEVASFIKTITPKKPDCTFYGRCSYMLHGYECKNYECNDYNSSTLFNDFP